MSFTQNQKLNIADIYANGASPREIAEQYNTYPNKIRRLLKSMGVKTRGHGEAQSIAIQTGRHPHPTKGTVRSKETKAKISNKMHHYWKQMSSEEKERLSKLAQERWKAMTPSERYELKKAATEAIRLSAKEGSKLEKSLRNTLTNEGYQVIFHKRGVSVDPNLELDLFIPKLRTTIEIDGPSHFLPIWGQANLKRQINSDAKKAGLILASDMIMIRIKHISKHVSQHHEKKAADEILKLLKQIESKFPEPNERYIEIEI